MDSLYLGIKPRLRQFFIKNNADTSVYWLVELEKPQGVIRRICRHPSMGECVSHVDQRFINFGETTTFHHRVKFTNQLA